MDIDAYYSLDIILYYAKIILSIIYQGLVMIDHDCC